MDAAATDDSTHQPGRNRRWSPWIGVLSGPILWLIQLIVGYGFVPYACDHGSNVSLYILAAVAALLTLGAGYVAWTQWRFTKQTRLMDLIDPQDAYSFLGSFGVLMSLLFLVLIGMTGFSAIFTNACPLITMKMP